MDNIVRTQSERAGMVDYSTNPESKTKTSTPKMATRDKNKKKKKKKVTWGTPPTRQRLFHQPTFDQQSLPGFSLQPIQAPWRHEMGYSLEWSTDPQFLNQAVATTQGDRLYVSAPQKTDVQRSILIDIHLIPLDPREPSELLLSRVPVDSLRAEIRVRSDIPPGWYRLEIDFWDEDPSRLDRHPSTKYPEKGEAWGAFLSNLVLSHGILKSTPSNALDTLQVRKVGVWRGEDAIEVTAIGPEVPEWREFVETVSQETRQERWGSEDLFEGRPHRALQEVFAEERQSREEFRMPRPVSGTTELQSRMKAFLVGLQGKASLLESQPQQPPLFERTHFPQELFRFKKAMSFMANRDTGSDFSGEELEELEDIEAEQGHRLAEQKLSWDLAKQRLDALMAVWNGPSGRSMDDDRMDPPGLSDLRIHIEHGRATVAPDESATWRSNCDRTVSWHVSDTMADDHVLLAVELIQAPDVLATEESEPSRSGGAGMGRTRAELIQMSLRQPRVAVLADRIPVSWGATAARVPTWVLPGTYQVRVKGVGRQGVQWVDVSQPFAVQSDPYVYSS
ncbi:hypothetical protein BGZ58_006959 [Dissophora ornata]|nr:hypothetical protein BGZ58_006959 [Dissophora ornata]